MSGHAEILDSELTTTGRHASLRMGGNYGWVVPILATWIFARPAQVAIMSDCGYHFETNSGPCHPSCQNVRFGCNLLWLWFWEWFWGWFWECFWHDLGMIVGMILKWFWRWFWEWFWDWFWEWFWDDFGMILEMICGWFLNDLETDLGEWFWIWFLEDDFGNDFGLIFDRISGMILRMILKRFGNDFGMFLGTTLVMIWGWFWGLVLRNDFWHGFGDDFGSADDLEMISGMVLGDGVGDGFVMKILECCSGRFLWCCLVGF